MKNFTNISTKTVLFPLGAKTEGVNDEILFWLRRTISSILIILSGLVLMSDKFVHINLDHYFGFPNLRSFLWAASVPACVLLHSLANLIGRPFLISYLSPVYVASGLAVFIFSSNIPNDDIYNNVYLWGSVAAFIIIAIFLNILFNKAYHIRNRKVNALKRALDLDIAPAMKILFNFITIQVPTKFVLSSQQEEYKREKWNVIKEVGQYFKEAQ